MTDSLKWQTRSILSGRFITCGISFLGAFVIMLLSLLLLTDFCTATEMLRLCKVMLAHNIQTLFHFTQSQQHEGLIFDF
jgi:hypothetical protein